MNIRSIKLQSLFFGMLGVLGFSITLPATRLAVVDLDPTFVGLGRAVIAAGLAAIILWIAKAPKPVGRQWLRLGATALGVVVEFPLLSTWAMKSVSAAHGAVIVGLIPLSTAVFGAWLAGERPGLLFWISTIVGSTVIAVFSFSSGEGSLVLLLQVDLVMLKVLAYQENLEPGKQSVGRWCFPCQCYLSPF